MSFFTSRQGVTWKKTSVISGDVNPLTGHLLLSVAAALNALERSVIFFKEQASTNTLKHRQKTDNSETK